MTERLLPDWIQGYLDATSNLEAKERLHLWTGMVCLSAALRRQVHMPMQYGPVYPNLFVFIIAESAAARKSTAVNYGKKLLLKAFPDVQLFGDDMTPQGLVKYMYKRATGDKSRPPGDFILFADELALLFGTEKNRASKMTMLLTTTYMCPDTLDHLTSRDSMERLYDLYPVVLGASDPKNLHVLPPDAVGGLTGRVLWIIEKEKRHTNAGWLEDDDRGALERDALFESLIHDLRIISQLKGHMKASPKARLLYKDWYEAMSNKKTGDKNTDAFYHRCHATAIQIAQLLAVSRSDSLLVNEEQMGRAIQFIELQLPEVRRITLWSGTGIYEQNRAKYVTFLQTMPGGKATRRSLLRHLGVVIDEFDRITLTLQEDGTIDAPRIIGSEMLIQLSVNGAMALRQSEQPRPHPE